jgi:hypothetical protein
MREEDKRSALQPRNAAVVHPSLVRPLMSEADIILRHLTDRVRADVNLLVQLGHVSESHASEFLEALPESGASVTVPARRLVDVPPPPAPKPVRAKALWAYNEQGTEPDLSFSAGDMVEIASRTNDDWWTGRVNGREGESQMLVGLLFTYLTRWLKVFSHRITWKCCRQRIHIQVSLNRLSVVS